MADPSATAGLGIPASGWTCPACGNAYPGDFAVCPRDSTARPEAASGTMDPLIGTVLGNTYKVVKLIGEGGMARLYQAEHLRVATKFAIKVIHADLAGDAELLVRFEREARAAGRIHSDHVVGVIDVLRTPLGRPCIVTELLDGEDLQARLDRTGQLEAAEAIPIARQICLAVAAAHAVGVVHRDLKPSNVFLCRGPEVKIKVFDFGVAKLEDDDKLTRTDAVVGTAAFMAPEQARRAADAGPLSDLYSIGAVVYAMLCGVPPYGSAPPLSRFALLLHEEPARPRELEPTIPAEVEAVIQHAMARDPKVRVQTALELEAELAELDAKPAAAVSSSAAASDAAAGAGGTGGATALAPRTPTPAPTRTTSATATELVRRARVARPLAIFLAAASSLAVGAWVAAMLVVVIGVPTTGGERSMYGLFAAAATAAIAVVHVRVLKPRWRSAPSVLRHVEPVQRALVAGVLTLGALDLLSYATMSVLRGEMFAFRSRIVLAGAAAATGLVWRRFGWDTRFRKRFG